MSDLHAQGYHTVAILDPGVKVDEGYDVWRQGSKGDHWVKTADGQPFVGTVWPGECNFPDFTRAATRAWWARLVARVCRAGVDGIWNDMNEPSVFQRPTSRCPSEACTTPTPGWVAPTCTAATTTCTAC